jgi:hypothetical protein
LKEKMHFFINVDYLVKALHKEIVLLRWCVAQGHVQLKNLSNDNQLSLILLPFTAAILLNSP